MSFLIVNCNQDLPWRRSISCCSFSTWDSYPTAHCSQDHIFSTPGQFLPSHFFQSHASYPLLWLLSLAKINHCHYECSSALMNWLKRGNLFYASRNLVTCLIGLAVMKSFFLLAQSRFHKFLLWEHLMQTCFVLLCKPHLFGDSRHLLSHYVCASSLQILSVKLYLICFTLVIVMLVNISFSFIIFSPDFPI